MAGFAWVTLATNDSYSLGALVLAHSLRRVGSKHDLAVLVTPGVTGAMREKLASVFSLVQEVNVLDSKDEANLALLARPELGITFTKLHCWRLTQYEKCVFVDADTLVIRNCDELFEREELSAAPDVGWPDCFNSGVFVFKPSQQTFASITSFAAAKGSFDGGDQGLLNQYFSDWAHKDISKHLPFIYNMCSTATYSYLPAFKQFGEDVRIIHFIGITKPWLQYFDTVTGQVQPAPGSNHLQPLLQLWWQIFCENVHPQLSPVMASSTLAPVWHEFNPFPSPPSHPRPDDVNEFSYDNIQSTEPDFSEFQDPWDMYTEESNQTYVPTPAPVASINDHHQHFSSNQNDNHHYHQSHPPSPQPQFTVHRQFDSGNHTPNCEKHHEYRHPSVLDDSQNKTQDNSTMHYEPPIEHRHFTDHPREQINHQVNFQTDNTSQTCNNNREKVDRKEDCHHESYHHHNHHHHHHEQTDHQEQNYHCNPEHHREQHIQQNQQHEQHQHHDHSFEKIHHQHNDHIHHEVKSPPNCHDRKPDNFCSNPPASEHSVSCHRVEHPIPHNNFKKHEENRQSTENRLQDNTNIDYREKQTDVCSTKSHSTPEYTTKSQSPPKPCSKSKSIATQSEPNIAGQLESNDAGIAGALAKITLGEARSPEQVAFEEHMRKQSWEQGQIDYMGRDSFENIWKKISETLGVQPQRQPSPPKTVPKPGKSEVDVVAPIATEDKPTAKKSEAAVLAEPRQKEEQDLISEVAPGEVKVIPQGAEVESEKSIVKEAVPAQSSSSDAAVSPVALAPIEPQLPAVKSPESAQKNDDETSVISTTTTTLDSSIPQACQLLSRDIKLDETAKSDLPETPAAAAAAIPLAEVQVESQKDVKVGGILLSESTSSQVPSDSPVPIQVAESVLEAEVKESVTEDLRPVTEEAISSISVSAQESVPAVLETVMQAGCPPAPTSNGGAVLDPISEIGNGIDALSLSSPIAVTSAAVTVAEGAPAVATSGQTEEISAPVLEATQGPAPSVRQEETSPLQVTTVEESKASTEAQQTAQVPAETLQEAKVATEIEQSSTPTVEPIVKLEEPVTLVKTEEISPSAVEPTAKPVESKPVTEIEKATPSTVEPVAEPEETKPLVATEQIAPSTVDAVGKPEESKLLPETEKSTSSSVEAVAAQEVSVETSETAASSVQLLEKSEETKVPLETEKPSPISAEATQKSQEAELSAKSEEPSPLSIGESNAPTGSDLPSPTLAPKATKCEEAKQEEIGSSTKSEEAVTCPIKPKSTTEEASVKPQEEKTSLPAVAPVAESEVDAASPTEASIKKEDPDSELKEEAEISEEIVSQSESSEESPVRPARTKEQQIPGTPTVIEATPPTSPPIGALGESFEEQPTKTTKKVVKKVVKKTTSTEAKPAEGSETEGEVKKVTKKVVKKIVKKTKEDDAAAGADAVSSSSNDKPKKVVKVVKKTTKSGQTLEAEANVPETPPPGTSDVPVPPKRKLKTIGKSTPAKSDPEP